MLGSVTSNPNGTELPTPTSHLFCELFFIFPLAYGYMVR